MYICKYICRPTKHILHIHMSRCNYVQVYEYESYVGIEYGIRTFPPGLGADWPCLHLGNARWAGRVEAIKGVIFVCKTGGFLHFAKVGLIQWTLFWAGIVIVENCPGQFSIPVRPCPGHFPPDILPRMNGSIKLK